MRIRKAVITVALAAAAIGATAATPALAAPATAAAAHNPYVGHNVGGGLLTRHALHVGQVINLIGSNGGRISNYRVTAEHRDAGVYYVTVWPRLQANGNGHLVLFTTSN
jgi:hypothetical protein